jgi:hypothetical protein
MGVQIKQALRFYKVTTTTGSIIVGAFSLRDAILNGLELLGHKSTLLSCLTVDDW